MSTTAAEALGIAALRFGGRAHIIDRDRARSFAELDAAAEEVAAALRRRALPPRARIALRIGNSFAGVAAVFGVWRAGGILVPLNPRLTRSEERTIAELSGTRLSCSIGDDPSALEIEERTAADDFPVAADVAAIAFTSGTTGKPKGVEITHANLLWSAAAVMHTRRDWHDSVAAVVSPICHLPVFVSHYLARLLSGGTLVIGAFDVGSLASALARHAITDLPLVPAMIAPLLDDRRFGEGSRLRRVTVGSALTPMETKVALRERFPGAEIVEAYGQTETTDGVTMTVGLEALERPGTVGRAHSILAVGIMSPTGTLVPPGVAGEIVCRGPTVMRGYHRAPEDTAAAMRDGWLRTGDLGRMDEDGYLFITGRIKEIIISGGENVSPEEVEAALATHPAVGEVAVFGVPDPRWGEVVAAAVVARHGVSYEDLVGHLEGRLARFKKPRRIWFVDSLPKTAAGKVKRRELRERLLGGLLGT